VCLRQPLFHDRAARDELAAPVFGRVGEAGNLQRLADLIEQFLLVDRLGEECERAALRRLHRIRNRAVGSEDDDAQAGRAALDFLEQADAVHLIHAQVGDDEIGTHAPERCEGRGGALDCIDLVILRAQTDREQPQQPRIVVND
jgi:hypothetical protein